MPNHYVPQPIRIHEVMEHQHFRLNPETCKPYENTYVRTGSTLALPNILIRRPTDGLEIGVSLWTLEDVSAGAMEPPGWGINQIDDPINALEMYTFDRGDWDAPGPVEGFYYLKFTVGPVGGNKTWWSDEIYISEAGDVAGWPNDCDGYNYAKLRWRDPARCLTSGESLVYEDDRIVERVPILGYPEGMDFFVFLKAGALIESDWEPVQDDGPETGEGIPKTDRLRMDFRWNLQGAPVTEGIIHAMKSSAFFPIVEIYFPSLAEALYQGSDITVEATSETRGCLYNFSYQFTAGYLLKQGCC